MSEDIYLEPRALLYGSDAAEAVDAGVAGRLAGGAVAFTQVRLHSRGGPGGGIRPYGDVSASSEGALQRELELIERTRPGDAVAPAGQVAVMGVVNVTPDSFSDGGEFAETATAIDHGRGLAEEGARILDIGGESTRPGSDAMTGEEELARVLPVIEGLRDIGLPISVDTRKADIMRRAAASGAAVINDISALQFDPDALAAAADLGLPVVLMHSRGDPKTMQDDPQYDDVLLDVFDHLRHRIAACVEAGIPPERIIADPGIGFGKTFEHNHTLLRGLTVFHGLGVRVLLGVSRKAFLGRLTDEPVAGKRVIGSVTAAVMGVMQGVQIVRVHDVRATVQAIRTWEGIWGRDGGDPV